MGRRALRLGVCQARLRWRGSGTLCAGSGPRLIESGQSLRLDFPIPKDADTYQWRAEFRSPEPREGYDEAGFHATFSGPETTRGLASRFLADGEWQEYARAYTIDPEATTGHVELVVSDLSSPWYEIRHLQVAFYADEGWPDYFDGDIAPTAEWTPFTPRVTGSVKRVWRQPTPPPAGTHYAWLGEPHASMSLRLDGGGNETARNTFAGGSLQLERPISDGYWKNVPNIRVDDDGTHYFAFGYGWSPRSGVPVEPGHVALSFYARQRTLGTSVGSGDVRISGTFLDANGNAVSGVNGNFAPYHAIPNDGQWHRITVHAEAPPEATETSSYFLSRASSGDEFDFSRFMVTTGDTEQEALEKIAAYFDGDTASDRAHDLWYNAEGVPHVWVNGQGWVAS